MATRKPWVGRGALSLAGLLAMVATMAGIPPAGAVESVRAQQWYLNAWNIEEAWRTSQGEGVTVALIDSGVDSTHPDLAGQVVQTPFGDGYGSSHGTTMASDIAGTGRGNAGQGAMGVAPKAKIISYKVGLLDSEVMDFDKLEAAIRAAADSPAQIINLSIEGGGNSVEGRAIAYAISRGKLVVAGSGNLKDINPPVIYPAAHTGVLGVAGHDQNGTVWSKSHSGGWVSIAAPSVDVVTACTGVTGYCKGAGTSHSAALTSGIAALVWAKYPHYTANQVIRVLTESANKPQGPVPNDLLGWGNISPRNALNWSGDPGPPDVNPLIGVRGDMPAVPSPSVSPSPSALSDPSNSGQSSAAPEAVAAPGDDGDDSGGAMTFTVAIIVAGAAVLGTGVFLFVRLRRNRSVTGWGS
ncbi:S8 family serine peptidase [Yinghuangia sp. ASG 101]|uniref:S8 family serine peptidase n=1 Tax=Yinghuangia sp. ASG 101 TaxID=2896848 RepID=UPI001E4793CA|nr:S8 family serine peptidase [Yinghuangia sp. ASG 101]UGQ14247.1 S8 family serine peptidase [Yinghuangia sp. ASG 101]